MNCRDLLLISGKFHRVEGWNLKGSEPMKGKKIRLFTVIWLVIITSSCTVKEETPHSQWTEKALMARTTYLSFQEGSAQCTVTADYGERVYDFSFVTSFSMSEEGLETTLSLTAPEELKGITVTQRGGDSRLEWDTVLLETGDLSENGLSPVTTFPTLMKAMQKGEIYALSEKEMFTPQGTKTVLELLTREGGETGVVESTLWLCSETLALLGGEIFVDGARVITCQVSQFVITS